MIKVIGISFKEKGQVYFFSPNNIDIIKGDKVVVETERGIQLGYSTTNIIEIEEQKLTSPLKNVIRIATNQDIKTYEKNIKDSLSALNKAKNIIEKNNMNMQIIEASYTLDRQQLVFKFLSDNRIDFRDLVKELANVFHTRIELRQIGARDKAKEISGCGMCGQTLCCSRFLKDMDSVSINMAKNQNISLNPNKINGLCGRLLCCLKYEDDTYTELKKGMPIVGKKIKTEKGLGTVVSIDIFKRKYFVNIDDIGIIEMNLEDGNN